VKRTPMPDSLMRQLEAWRMQWVLLQLAVQLDQRWLPSLRAQSEDAVEEVFSIARKLAGVGHELVGLGELRKHLLAHAIETGATLADGLSALAARSGQVELRSRRAEDVLFVARMLDRSVGMRSGELTVNPAAQRALWSSISSTHDRSEPPRRGPEVMRQACSHVLSRLDDWLEEERQQTQVPGPDSTRAMRSHANHS
jgi:hypothetical protein